MAGLSPLEVTTNGNVITAIGWRDSPATIRDRLVKEAAAVATMAGIPEDKKMRTAIHKVWLGVLEDSESAENETKEKLAKLLGDLLPSEYHGAELFAVWEMNHMDIALPEGTEPMLQTLIDSLKLPFLNALEKDEEIETLYTIVGEKFIKQLPAEIEKVKADKEAMAKINTMVAAIVEEQRAVRMEQMMSMLTGLGI